MATEPESNPDAGTASQQSEVGAMAEGSRLSGGFDSIVQAGMMFLQANVMKAAYETSKRYYNIAAKDDATWQSLYVPVMRQFADEMFAVPARPLDNAFFRARSLVPAAKLQNDWYNIRLMTSRYSYGARENLDYMADTMTRWTRVTSAYVGLSLAEGYYETYKEQRRMHMAQAITLGKEIQASAMSSLAQAVDMKSKAAADKATAIGNIGGTFEAGRQDMRISAYKVLEQQRYLKDHPLPDGSTSLGPKSTGGLIKQALGIGSKKDTGQYSGSNISTTAQGGIGSGSA